ncbi:MAG: recombination mediator RecR [Pseudomonadota bacterium]|nr:recombination mediator RecR [Pseudomonadota bacterium]
MSGSSLIQELIEALKCLPGVGDKTAQRMTFHLLERDREGARLLAGRLADAVERVGHCGRCRTLSEHTTCAMCASPGRRQDQLCVVESPADVMALDASTGFRGQFFVLMGRLSPLDGIGPDEIGLDVLEARLDEGEIEEVILATNPTVEGEVTAHVLGEMAQKRGIRSTRLAQGVPIGGELEYLDGSTLAQALDDRRDY